MRNHFLRAVPKNKVYNFVNSYVSTSNQTTYTFTNCDIGTASSDRYVVVYGTGYTGSVVTNRNVSSVSIGGSSATVDYAVNSTAAPSFFAKRLVTAGTTATIEVTLSGSMANYGIAIFVIYGLNSTTPISTGTGNAATAVLNLTATEGGVVLGGIIVLNITGTGSITGVNLDFDKTVESSTYMYGGAANTTASSASITFNNTGAGRRYIGITYY